MTLSGDNWLYEEASLKKSGFSLLNSARKQWCQCLRNINAKLKLGGVFKSVSARAVQHSMGTFAAQLTCLRKVCGHVTVSDHRLSKWNETWLCLVTIGCTKKLLWKYQVFPCWIQRENNDVNVKMPTVSVNDKIIIIQKM
jgi:hypothetical protein